jgi:hypothetical protein
MKPLVSILIPAYNAEKWLAETLRTALAQTWDNKEIIVVDDGSKDGTLALARTFESDSLKVFTKGNQGAAATRNKAFSLCHGAYIQWLDADDLIAPDKIAKQMEVVLAESLSSRVLLSGEWGRFMHRPSKAQFAPSGLWCNLSKAEWLMRKMEQNTYIQTACWLVSRQLTEAAGPWDTRLLGDDDGEYFCRVLLASEGVRFASGARVYYRLIGPGSLSYIGKSDRKRDAQWTSMELHVRYLRSLDDSKRARDACVTFLQNWMDNFYPDRLDIFEKARALAKELGGQIDVPPLSWKYSWIRALFGWQFARWAQTKLLRLKWSTLNRLDNVLSLLDRRRPVTQQGD